MSSDRSCFSRYVAVARIARRDLCKNPKRTAVVVLLIAVPVALVFGALTVWDAMNSPLFLSSQWLGRSNDVQAAVLRVSSELLSRDPALQAALERQGDRSSMHFDPSQRNGLPVDLTVPDLLNVLPHSNSISEVDVISHVTATTEDAENPFVFPSATQLGDLNVPGLDFSASRESLSTGEAIISQDVAAALNVSAGDRIHLSATVKSGGLPKRMLTRAQIAEIVDGERILAFGSGTFNLDPMAVAAENYSLWYVKGRTPVTWENVRSLNELGFIVVSRAVLTNPPPRSELSNGLGQATTGGTEYFSWSRTLKIGGFALLFLELFMLVSPLHAAQQRSLTRTLAIISANGGDRRVRQWMMLTYGLLIGLIASAVTLLLIVVAGLIISSVLHVGLFVIDWTPAVHALLTPLGVSLAASVGPARSASHIDAARIMSGRTWFPSRLVRRHAWYPIALSGAIILILIAAWCGNLWVFLLGLLLFEAGLIGSIPYLFNRWRFRMRRVSVGFRIAIRDAVRNGHRTFPAMASMMTTVFLACAMLIGCHSANSAVWNSDAHLGHQGEVFVSDIDQSDTVAGMRTRQERTIRSIEAVTQIDSQTELRGMAWTSGIDGPPYAVEVIPPNGGTPVSLSAKASPMRELDLVYVVDDGTYLERSGIARGAQKAQAIQMLRSGGVLVPEDGLISDGRARVRSLNLRGMSMSTAHTDIQAKSKTIHLMEETFPAQVFTHLNVVVLSPEAATKLRVPARPLGQLLELRNPVSAFAASSFEVMIEARSPGGDVTVISPTTLSFLVPYLAAILAIIAAASTIALVVTLAASDIRTHLETLDVIGAFPELRQQVTVFQGLILAMNCIPVAVVSGLFVGFFATITVSRAGLIPELSDMIPVVPWSILATLLVGIPVLSALVAIVLTPSRRPLERRVD
ncbi:ABC transporter permease [Schaalia sp. ZJ405]|uniref:ABC transporter permease n=1 Tax=Schaalia sp. ZJ405 TaxID=2709403 RepID=UPI0013ED2F59|nr:ABC transporter permease [Schaalia sp. ZJ405]QPK81079.1 ABC transporter permease [Schaalia sp. ZJ405]